MVEEDRRRRLRWLLAAAGALMAIAAVVLLAADSATRATDYTTVYLIERSLSLDNLFVFLLLFAYFGVPIERRARWCEGCARARGAW